MSQLQKKHESCNYGDLPSSEPYLYNIHVHLMERRQGYNEPREHDFDIKEVKLHPWSQQFWILKIFITRKKWMILRKLYICWGFFLYSQEPKIPQTIKQWMMKTFRWFRTWIVMFKLSLWQPRLMHNQSCAEFKWMVENQQLTAYKTIHDRLRILQYGWFLPPISKAL